jgi:hypothetical protein
VQPYQVQWTLPRSPATVGNSKAAISGTEKDDLRLTVVALRQHRPLRRQLPGERARPIDETHLEETRK